MNLLEDPMLSVETDSGVESMALPAVLAGLASGSVHGFPALVPHQRPAWHMFLVQLAALALGNLRVLPEDPVAWGGMLRDLTKAWPDDAPWCLTADDSQPAFMQPPIPPGLKWRPVRTPDSLDMVVTARNHDVKQGLMKVAAEEDWVYALVSLQTRAGWGGSGKYGIVRMNGGYASRPMLRLAPVRSEGESAVDWSASWARDVRLVLRRGFEDDLCKGTKGLVWCEDWPEGSELDLAALHPMFIETCRRVRLRPQGSGVVAYDSRSETYRVAKRGTRGFVGGDPWVPVNEDGESFTLKGDFGYRRLFELLYSGKWKLPLLADIREDDGGGSMVLLAECLAGGQGETEGFHSRVVPLPRDLGMLASKDVRAKAAAQIKEIEDLDKALRAAVAAGAARGKPKKEHYRFANVAKHSDLNDAA